MQAPTSNMPHVPWVVLSCTHEGRPPPPPSLFGFVCALLYIVCSYLLCNSHINSSFHVPHTHRTAGQHDSKNQKTEIHTAMDKKKPSTNRDKEDAPTEPTITLPVSVLLKILASAGFNQSYAAKDVQALERFAQQFAKFYASPVPRFDNVISSLHKYPRGSGMFGFAFADGTIATEADKTPGIHLLKRYQTQQMGAPAPFLFGRIVEVVRMLMHDPEVKNSLFMIGKATSGKTATSKGGKPYLRTGMVKRWGDKYKPEGYKGVICLAMFDKDTPKRECHYNDPEAEAIALENLLHREFADHEYYHDGLSNSQSGSLSQRTHDDYYAVTYLAFGGKLENGTVPAESDTNTCSAGGPSTRTRSRRADNIRNPSSSASSVQKQPSSTSAKGKAKTKV